MRTIRYILYIIVLLILVIFLFAWYIGYFNSVMVVQKETGGYLLAGREYTGPHSDAGKNIMHVMEELKAKGIEGKRSFGIYYDAPGSKNKESYRSFVGSIIESYDSGRLPELNSAGFRIDSVPFSMSLVVEFPLKNSLSYMIGPMKAYPAFSKYNGIEKCKNSYSLEVYDKPAKKIIFIMPCN